MEGNKFPTESVVKDISEIAARLRRRRIIFNRDIRVIAPSNIFGEAISVTSTDGPNGESWTNVLVKDTVRSQE